MNTKRAFAFFLNLLCALIIILPSGKIFYFNTKLLASLVLISLLFKVRKEIDLRKISKFVFCSFLFLIFISVSVTVGYVNNFNDTVLKELYMFLGFYVVFLVYYLAYRSNKLDKKAFFETIFFSSFVFYLIKVVIWSLLYAHVLNVESLSGFILRVFNSDSMIGPVVKGMRINFVFDLFSIFIVVFLRNISEVCSDQKNNSFLYVYILLSSFSIYLAYSRYIWFSFLLLMTLKCLFNLKDILERKIFCTAIVSFMLCVFLFSNPFDRISGADTQNSDKIRVVQSNFIAKDFVSHPLLGLGMGGYDKDCIRSIPAIFAYEMEIPAFLMKFGVIGFLTLCAILFFYLQKLYANRSYFLLFSFLVALSYGFFNPYVIKSPFSLLMFMLYLLSEHEAGAAAGGN